MIKKENLCFVLIITLLLTIMPIGKAMYTDIPDGVIYQESVSRLNSLGIITGYSDGTFKPEEQLSRAQFAKIAVLSIGGENVSLISNSSSVFLDVDPNHWASGYINMAARENLIMGYGDGSFRPEEPITYAQAITIILKMLNYNAEDIGGQWPYSYIERAGRLGLTSGIELGVNDIISRGLTALLIDRALFTDVKGDSGGQNPLTLLETSRYQVMDECIILATHNNDSSIGSGEIRTNKGIFKNTVNDMDKYMGYRGKLVVGENDIIKAFFPQTSYAKEVIVDTVTENDVRVLDNGVYEVIRIADYMIVYYQGVEGIYRNNSSNISKGSSLILALDRDGRYEYAVLFDHSLANYVSVEKVIVENVTENSIRVVKETGTQTIITLENNTPIYYEDVKGTFASNKENIEQGSTLELFEGSIDEYEYVVLYDPEFIGPVIADKDITVDDEYIGSIDISEKENTKVIKNGDRAELTDIKKYDVVYLLKNSPDTTRRIFVYDEKISGRYDEALPSKAFVNKIIISGTEVELATQTAVAKVDERPEAFKIGEGITALTDRKGRAIDIVNLNVSDVSDYAVVISTRQGTSEEKETKGKREHIVALLKTDGTTSEYIAASDYTNFKGELVRFELVDGLLELKRITYNPQSGEIDKSEYTIGGQFYTRDVKIFDLISNSENADAVVRLVEMDDITFKQILKDEAIHAVRGGPFNDIQLLFLNNATNTGYRYGILLSRNDKQNSRSGSGIAAASYDYKMDIGGVEMNFNGVAIKYGAIGGQPIAVDIEGNTINRMFSLKQLPTSPRVVAIDDERIRLDNGIYRLASDVQVYRRMPNRSYELASLREIKPGSDTSVYLYTDREIKNGGRVRVIIIR